MSKTRPNSEIILICKVFLLLNLTASFLFVCFLYLSSPHMLMEGVVLGWLTLPSALLFYHFGCFIT